MKKLVAGAREHERATRYQPGVRPAPPVPVDEEARVEAVRAHEIVATPPERDFDDIASLAAAICDTPMSAVTFIDTDRQWLKARVGLEMSETPRSDAFCAHAIVTPDEVTVVHDALADERFATNPLVVADPNVRFYAGAPVVTSDGHALGAVCVLDSRPRTLREDQIAALSALARQASAQLELRRNLAAEAAAAGELVAAVIGAPAEGAPLASSTQDPTPAVTAFRIAVPAAGLILAVAAAVLLGRPGSALAKNFSNLMWAATSAAAAVACVFRAARTDSSGWRWLAAACGTWSAGVVVWAFFGITRAHVYPFPSVADVGLVGYVVPALVGLWRLRVPHARTGARVWTVLDGAVIACTTLFVSWATVLGPLLAEGASSLLAHVVTLAYPIVDVVVFSAVLAIGLRQRGPDRRAWALLAVGFSTLAITDSFYMLQQHEGTYEQGHLLDLGWLVAFSLVALAALTPEFKGRPWLERRLDALQELVPFGPVAAAVVAAAATGVSPRSTPFLFWFGLATAALIAARQVTIVAEKVSLTARLEERVSTRTSELDAQRRFLGSVLASLEEAVAVYDASGKLTLFNDAMSTMAGPDVAKVPLDAWCEHYRLRTRDGATGLATHDLPQLRVLQGELVRDFELTMQTPGQAPSVVSVNGRPITSSAGAVVGAVIAARDITDRARARQDMERRANKDELTGLANRAAFNQALSDALAGEGPVSVLLLDIDDFKQVNDTLGHSGGDSLLIDVAGRLAACVRPEDVVARLGGDEFTVIATSDLAGAEGLAGRILAALELPVRIAEAMVHARASIGVVTAEGTRNASELLRHADLAMYDAKATCKGGYSVFSQALADTAATAASMERELREALRNDDLQLAFQPVIELATGQIKGVEALLRWTHPTRGAVSPAEFIPIAERCGLILPIGEWVLHTACRQLAAWEETDSQASRLTMAVNVSIRQLERPGFVDAVRAAIANAGVSAERLILEITESVLVDDPAIAAQLEALRDVGVKLAIDDFGTGYSSLARLRDYAVDYLKVDRSLVEEIDAPSGDAPILRAALAMGAGLGLSVIAEGIETTSQYQSLRRLGCEEGQGFLMSRPLTPDDILPLLRDTLGPVTGGGNVATDTDIEAIVAAAISAEVDLEGLVRPLLDVLQQITGLDSTYLTRIDWDALEQHISYSHNAGAMTIPEGLVVEWSDTLCRRALEDGVPKIDDVAATCPDSAAAAALGIASYVTVPIELEPGEIYGTLCGTSTKKTVLNETEMAVVRLFGRLIAEKLRQTEAER